ncbi:MAG: WecB/TagA/CpsF family glycosyltransferase [Gammaproteobacteria bacterium]|nr:WecB/TagA/CpsF family glycosyltransferase [Gammaproteobacteria bacterium]
MKRIELLDIPMHVATMQETLNQIDQRLNKQQFTQHVVINVAKLVNMRKDDHLRSSVEACDIINIDGMGIVWGARLLGHSISERVAGIDLFHELLELAAHKDYPVYFLGATQDILDQAVGAAKDAHPKLKLAGYHHGYFWNDEASVVEKIHASGAKMLFVAITSPKKENFINTWKDQLGVDFVMGVGGTFDILAGKTRRSPKWMQNCGLEWLFRVLQEPERMWKRYLITNSVFAWLLFKDKFKSVAIKAISYSR